MISSYLIKVLSPHAPTEFCLSAEEYCITFIKCQVSLIAYMFLEFPLKYNDIPLALLCLFDVSDVCLISPCVSRGGSRFLSVVSDFGEALDSARPPPLLLICLPPI